jgi:hypothetical protein
MAARFEQIDAPRRTAQEAVGDAQAGPAPEHRPESDRAGSAAG